MYAFDRGLKNTYASLIPGNLWNQYAMDADAKGNVRAFVSDRRDGKNTNALYIISPKGTIAGKLENIAPGEAQHGVRFIDNYAYLVTFRQIDPLFVIDVSDATAPKIMGELKMPGYSSYLHPYGNMEQGVQYLIGLGYNTRTGEWGGEVQDGIKLDLYKVDFNTKDAQ